MTVSESGRDQWGPPGPPLGQAVLRALDPRLTARIRAERARYEALSGRLRPGSSIAVVGLAPRAGRSTVAALVALALARYQGPLVLAVDTGAGLYHRLAQRPGGSAHAVLVGLGVRGAHGDGPRPTGGGGRWLRQRLALAEVMLLGSDPALAETPVTAEEYPGALRALGRWFPVVVTDTPPLSNDSVVPAAVAAADRVVIVGPDDDQGPHWISTCRPWVTSVGAARPGQRVAGVLVRSAAGAGAGRRTASRLDSPLFTVPFDGALARTPVRWDDLAAQTRATATALAAHLVDGLGA